MATSTLTIPSYRPLRYLTAVLWTVLLAAGGYGVWLRLAHGHADANYGSYVVWGLWVAAYIYFIGLSAGAFLMSSLVYVFRVRQLEAIGRLSLFTALVTLLMALMAIWFDLGHMERFYYVFTRPNFASMMTWMVWLYTAYFILLVAELILALQPGRREHLLRVLGAAGIPLAVAFHGGVGALFGTVAARPFWHTPLYPILFLTGALVSGGALITATVAFFWPPSEAARRMVTMLGRLVLALLLFDLLLEFAEFSIPMWYGQGPENDLLRRVLFGPFWWVFWVVHIALGSVIPIVMLTLRGRSTKWVGAACALIAVSFMAVRLNIVVPGLIEPQLRGIEEAFTNTRLMFAYVPSLAEWGVVGFLIAVGLGLMYAGSRLLPLIGPADGVSQDALPLGQEAN
jgi:protein NrfD